MEIKKLVICPIRHSGNPSAEFRTCYVSVVFDAMKEPNLTSVIDQITDEDLLPIMDTWSKQKTLHNLFGKEA